MPRNPSHASDVITHTYNVRNHCTKRGKVRRILQEHYLRHDICCVSDLCTDCSVVNEMDHDDYIGEEDEEEDEEEFPHAQALPILDTLSRVPYKQRYVIPTADVVAQQMDILELSDCLALTNLIILESVWNQVKKNSLGKYNRLHALLKSNHRHIVVFANEHHEETYIHQIEKQGSFAIATCGNWYLNHLQHQVDILLLANSVAEVDKLQKHVDQLTQDKREDVQTQRRTLHVQSIHHLVEEEGEKYPKLHDLLAAESTTSALDNTTSSTASSFYPAHLPMADLLVGVKARRYFQGTLKCNRESWMDCYVMLKENNARVAVQIQGFTHVNRAMDGDVVVIELLPVEQWDPKYTPKKSSSVEEHTQDESQEEETPMPVVEVSTPTCSEQPPVTTVSRHEHPPQGKVVGILERQSWRKYCGSIDDTAKNSPLQSRTSLFCPVDRKVPKIRIQTRQRELLEDKRIVVAIDQWPVESKYPLGHYVETIGPIGDKATETQVLLHEYNIPQNEFSDQVLACLPPSDWKITPENSIGRRDLRDLRVMSIDPPGCKDIDDALHVRMLPNGHLEVGVHIADVTHFVPPNSALDLEAADRGTSTYLVERRLDMLPGLLTTELCSLRAHEDHFAFSILWEMDPETFDVVQVDFCKSIIHSVAAMSYGQAQVLLDEPEIKSVSNDSNTWSVQQLFRVSQVLRERRMDAGALTLASPEVRFVLDTETQNPLDVQMYALKHTNALVEEFMLLANITVSKKILRHYPTFALLRRHPSPSKSQFDPLIAAAKSVGVNIDVTTSKHLAESLDKARRYSMSASKHKSNKKQKSEDVQFNKMLRILTTRCMMPAAYFCSGEVAPEEYHHYGLAAPIYTHFTSPIRRYADVVVHRLLASAIGVSPLPHTLENKAALHELASGLNRRHLGAQMAGRASVSLHTLIYFREHPTETPGVVIKLRENGVRVLLPRFGIEGMIFLCEKGHESSVVFHEKEQTIARAAAPDTKLHFLDSVMTYVTVEKHQLKIRIVKPHAFASIEEP